MRASPPGNYDVCLYVRLKIMTSNFLGRRSGACSAAYKVATRIEVEEMKTILNNTNLISAKEKLHAAAAWKITEFLTTRFANIKNYMQQQQHHSS